MTAVIFKLKDETKKKIVPSTTVEEKSHFPSLVRKMSNGQEMEIRKYPRKKKHLISSPPLINIIINRAATFKAPNLWRESKICSKLTFFGPKVEPSSLLPHPKTATPVWTPVKEKNQNTKWKICLRLWSLSVIIFSSSRLSLFFFLKSSPTFYFLSFDFSLWLFFLHHPIFTP